MANAAAFNDIDCNTGISSRIINGCVAKSGTGIV